MRNNGKWSRWFRLFSGTSVPGSEIALLGNDKDSGEVNPDPDAGEKNQNNGGKTNEDRVDIQIFRQTAADAGDYRIGTFCPVESLFPNPVHDG